MISRCCRIGIAAAAIAAWAVSGAQAGCGSCGPAEEGDKQAGCGAMKSGCGAKAEAACTSMKAGCGAKAEAGCGSACEMKAHKHGNRHGEAKESKEITTAGLEALIKAEADVAVFDARSGKYDDGKRIPGAKSLNAGSSEKEIAQAAPDKEQVIVTYCSNTKCPASAKLAERLRSMGYQNVIEYPVGIQGWIEAGHEVVN